MILRKLCAFFTMFFLIAPLSLHAFDIPVSESSFLEFKGDLTYTAKVRTEDPDPALAPESKGNSNFEKGDLMNNKGIARIEITFDSSYITLFGKGEAFYDRVMDDDDKYPEGADIDEAKKYAARRYEAMEYYLDFHSDNFTLRAGRQIVEWGESIAPVYAPGVGVINIIDSSRIGAAGYTFRDAKVPGLMAWASYEITVGLAVEGVYAPDFNPRYAVPVVGTSSSFMDVGGFGAPEQFMGFNYDDRRPTEFEDMQQYGGAIRKIFSSLNNFEMGFYYFHYYDWSPLLSVDTSSAPITIFADYEDLDMYGISFSHVILALGLDMQINGELAYRPDEPAQVLAPGEMPAGFEKTRTLNWGLGGSRIFSDFFSFTPWIVQFQPMFEFYGGNNLDYDNEEKLNGNTFAEPEHTAYYMVSLNFDTSDMIDNTRLFLTISGMGTLHKEQNSLHGITTTINARIGDSIGILFGYEYRMGDPEEASMSPNNMPDRDAFTCSFTYYLM